VSIANYQKIIISLSCLILVGFCFFPATALADYENVGSFTSTNIIPVAGAAQINSFSYTITIPAGAAASVQFSTDNSTWYNSAGTLNGINALTDGTSSFDLSARGWSGYAFYYKIIFSNSNVAVTPTLDSITISYFDINGVYSTYNTSGSFTSTNLLSGITSTIISSFIYKLDSLPPNTTAIIQFSKDNSTWYNSSAVLNGSNALSAGTNTISLSGLSWSGGAFYYKVSFTSSDGLFTPVLDSITLNYSTPIVYYWYGGTGNWSDYTNHWSTNSGNSPSAPAGSAPVAGDNVVFDSNSGTGTVTVDSDVSMTSFTHSQTGLTVAMGIYNFAVSGDSTVTNGTTTIGVSSSTGWTTSNLTIGAGGTASSTAPGTIYYNQVTVSGTLNADVVGTYTVVGIHNSVPYYRRGSDAAYIYKSTVNQQWYVTTSFPNVDNYRWYQSASYVGTYSPAGSGTGNATVSNVGGSGEYTRLNNSKITIAGNYDQSATTSKFLAASSLITVNGNGNFTADFTQSLVQYNQSSLVLNGNNTLTVNNLSSVGNGFGNMIVGQDGSTTTLAGNWAFGVKNSLTVGSGTLQSKIIYFYGKLNVDSLARVLTGIYFASGGQQTIPASARYGDLGVTTNGTVVIQEANIIANRIIIQGDGGVNYSNTWKTNGYNLTVGRDLWIGTGADTALKKLDATNYTNPDPNATSTITVGGNWLNYGNGTAPSQFVHGSSTVIFNATSTGKTITLGATNSAFYNVQFNGTGGVWTLQDPLVVAGNLTHSAGTLNAGGHNITTAGNFTISDGALISASGLNSNTYYNQVEVSGTLSPDATGVYTYMGVYGGLPYWTNGQWYIFKYSVYWAISSSLGEYTGDRWRQGSSNLISPVSQGFNSSGGNATGVPFVSNITSSGFIGSTITVGGNFSASGNSGALLTLNPSSTWRLNVAGTATADYVNVDYSDASGGTLISQTNSTDGGHNTNWGFDLTAPTTTASATSNGGAYTFDTWTGYNVSVTLSCADNAGGDGCAGGYPKYCVDTTNTCNPVSAGTSYTVPVEISTEGISYIRYYSSDVSSNAETVQSSTIKIDTTKPITVASAGGYTFDTWTASDVTTTLTCADAGGSGCSAILYCVDTDNTCTPNLVYTVPVLIQTKGTSYIRYASTDFATNSETAKTQTINILNVPSAPSFVSAEFDKIALSWVTTADPVGTQYYVENITNSANSGWISTNSWESAGLNCSTDYSFQIKTRNADLTETNWSATAILRTRNCGGQIPGVINPPITIPVTPIVPPANIIEQIILQVQNIANAFKPNAEKPKIKYPPITESVPEITPLALQGWNIMEVKPLSELSLTPISSNIAFFADKIPQFRDTLLAFGIDVNSLSDVQKVSGVELYLPGLTKAVLSKSEILAINKFEAAPALSATEMAGASGTDKTGIEAPGDIATNKFEQNEPIGGTEIGGGVATGTKGIENPGNLAINKFAEVQGVPLARLSSDALEKMPSDIVFVRAKGELIDYSMAISVDKAGEVQQKINTLAGKPMELVMKPDSPAKNVTGFITLKKITVGKTQSNVLGYITKALTASLVDSTSQNVPATSTDNALLIKKFAYEEVSPGIYKASINAPNAEGEYDISTVIMYEDINIAPKETKMTAIVNPEGYVYSQMAEGRLRIKGVSILLQWLNPQTNKYETWPADKFLQKNPLLTDDTGKYSFLVPEGTYKIEAKAPNYTTFTSEPFVMKESIAVSKDIELFKKQGLFSWLNWQVVITFLLSVLIIYNIWQNEKVRSIVAKILRIKKVDQ
jgi:hypothetical protein